MKHALRGALLPIVSYAGPAAAALLTGSIIVESIFAIPVSGDTSSRRRSTETTRW